MGSPIVRYVGTLTKRGVVGPGGRIELSAKVLTSSPGVFEVSNWELVTEVGNGGGEGEQSWVEHGRYVEVDVGDPLRVEVLASLEPRLI